MGLLEKPLGPETSLTSDSHPRAQGNKTQGSNETSLAGLCNSLFTSASCLILPKLSSGNESFPVLISLAKHSVLVSDNVLSIKPVRKAFGFLRFQGEACLSFGL